MQQLSVEERKILEGRYLEGYRFIARDENGDLFGFKKEPEKENTIWWGGVLFCYLDFDLSFLELIKWEDDEPYEIEKLLEGDNNEKKS